MICKDCERKNQPRRRDIPPAYCEVCGFGFLKDPQNNQTNVTCLKYLTYQQAVDSGAIKPGDMTIQTSPGLIQVKPGNYILPSLTAELSNSPSFNEVEKKSTTEPPMTVLKQESQDRRVETLKSLDVSTALCSILQALEKQPLIGKSRILELSGIREEEYLVTIKQLLVAKKIEQVGTKKGAKYKLT